MPWTSYDTYWGTNHEYTPPGSAWSTHDLRVEHETDLAPFHVTHGLYLNHTDRTGLRHHDSVKQWTSPNGETSHELEVNHMLSTRPGPIPEPLRKLIESHRDNHAWMPLLDALVEQYGDAHPAVDAAIQHHTAARAETNDRPTAPPR